MISILKYAAGILLLLAVGQASAEDYSRDALQARLAIEQKASGFDPNIERGLGKAFGTYEPFVVVGKRVLLTSSASQKPDKGYVFGKVSRETPLQEIFAASRWSCLKALNRLSHAVDGDLSKVRKIAVVNHMTAMSDGFENLEAIGDQCSDMVVRIFGDEVGAHVRTVMAVSSFPSNLSHEVEFTVFLK